MKKPNEYPLHWPAGWPRAKSRKDGQFRTGRNSVTYAAAEKRVYGEIMRLHAGKVEIICSSNMIRDRQPQDPGVAVYFQSGDKPMRVIAVDIYKRVEDNLAAVAATIEALRAIERHGGAQILERAFTGFDALPGPRKPHEVLGVPVDATKDQIESTYRRLAKEYHPDTGGDAERFKEITAAREQLLKEKEP